MGAHEWDLWLHIAKCAAITAGGLVFIYMVLSS